MVDSLSASDGQAGRYIENTPEHPYIPYDAPSVRGRARITSGKRGQQDTSAAWSPGGISDVIREHPIPFVMFAASAGILFAAWMGYRRYGVPDGIRDNIPGLRGSHSDRTSVGWAMPDGSASHSDTITGEAADVLGQTNRENPLPRPSPRPAPPSTGRVVRRDTDAPIFDRP